MGRITDAVHADHRDLESYYERILHAEDEDEQTRLQNHFTWELARHVVGEDLVVFPALEKYLRDGDATEDRQKHHIVSVFLGFYRETRNDGSRQIKQKLQVFQDLNCADPRFIPTLTILMDDLKEHIHTEETMDLVKLENAVTAEESERLAQSFGRTKLFAPTRAHPELPDRPPYETAMGLLMAPLDHLQDLFRRWPEGEMNPEAEVE